MDERNVYWVTGHDWYDDFNVPPVTAERDNWPSYRERLENGDCDE